MPRTAKTKKKPSEKEVGGDGFKAILLVAVNETTSLYLQEKSQRMATMKSKIAGSKKKSSNAATSTSEEPPNPEDGARKHPPEELVEVEKPIQKVTTFWRRGNIKRVIVVDLPKGKDTGPPSNENGISFHKQCKKNCISSSSTPHNPCCERETHMSLNNVGEYVVFSAKTVHRDFFSAVRLLLPCNFFGDTAIVPNCLGSIVQQL
jgi:hypothetical protein